ncbi:MAG: YicC/YloC family endoribonuclease [Pirellulales bacterium]
MTGFGEARRQNESLVVSVEVRTINGRYFKLGLKCPEGYGAWEAEIENLVRHRIRRGSVQVSLRVDHLGSVDTYRLDPAVLAGYRRQINELNRQWNLTDSVRLESLLSLPGVVLEGNPAVLESEWPVVRETLQEAMQNLDRMRGDEGQAMAADLKANCRLIAAELDGIAERAPAVVEAYRARLAERLQTLLSEYSVTLDPADLIKEVGIFAERSDISEEIVRLRSHLEQFDTIMDQAESAGRKLEFLTQEMFRETNTIGSKAGDVQIARHVIEVKAAIERIREMIQNIE